MIKQMLKNLFAVPGRKLYAEDLINQQKQVDDSIVLSLTQDEIYASRYRETLELFKASMKAGLLRREQVIYIQNQLIEALGDKMKYYRSNNYKNSANMIYDLLKSPFLCNHDYDKLIKTINLFTDGKVGVGYGTIIATANNSRTLQA